MIGKITRWPRESVGQESQGKGVICEKIYQGDDCKMSTEFGKMPALGDALQSNFANMLADWMGFKREWEVEWS